MYIHDFLNFLKSLLARSCPSPTCAAVAGYGLPGSTLIPARKKDPATVVGCLAPPTPIYRWAKLCVQVTQT